MLSVLFLSGSSLTLTIGRCYGSSFHDRPIHTLQQYPCSSRGSVVFGIVESSDLKIKGEREKMCVCVCVCVCVWRADKLKGIGQGMTVGLGESWMDWVLSEV